MTVDVVVLIGITGTVSGILFGYVGYKRGEKTEHYQAGSDKGSLVSDTQYIKRRIDDVLLEQKDTNKSMNALSERVTRVEESTKSAHRRIDVEIEKR